jgi:hypothetical protein
VIKDIITCAKAQVLVLSRGERAIAVEGNDLVERARVPPEDAQGVARCEVPEAQGAVEQPSRGTRGRERARGV